MSRRRTNAGKGYGYMFHGAFASKKDAQKKERSRKGAFIKTAAYPSGLRYLVMSERKNPIKRKRRKNKVAGQQRVAFNILFARHGQHFSWERYAHTAEEATRSAREALAREFPDRDYMLISVKPATGRNPSELMVMGANPNPTHYSSREIRVHPGETITLRVNPTTAAAPRENIYFGFGPAPASETRLTLYKAPRGGRSRTVRTGGGRESASAALRADVASALVNQGYSRAEARRMAKRAQGADFSAMFNDALRSNPSASAIRESFTGREVDRVKIYSEPHMPAGDYAMLGRKVTLYVKPLKGGQVLIVAMPGAIAVSDETARQIWFVGGDQDVSASLDQFGAREIRPGIYELGEARQIDYKQRKEHVEHPEHDEWRHNFGEESGVLPTVLFDAGAKRLLLEGGEYRIREEGIVN